jgi:ABC-type multidrug transport system fused ATPase/permease subunit
MSNVRLIKMAENLESKKEKKLASIKSVTRVYWEETRKFKWAFALLILGNIGIQVADLAVPWYLRQFVNTLAQSTPSAALVSELVVVVGVIAAISVGGFLARLSHLQRFNYGWQTCANLHEP